MKVSDLIEALQQYPPDANARAYEGEVCGIIVEERVGDRPHHTRTIGVIKAHESDEYSGRIRE